MKDIETDPRYQELLADSEKSSLDNIQWLGDQVGTVITVRSIIDSDDRPVSEEERKEALAFYNGEQWDSAIEKARLEKQRPTLVLNRLPELLAAALANDPMYNRILPGQCLSTAEREEIELAKVLLVRRNRDAQKMYNYEASARAESTALAEFGEAAK
jgi:hypothetical protein